MKHNTVLCAKRYNGSIIYYFAVGSILNSRSGIYNLVRTSFLVNMDDVVSEINQCNAINIKFYSISYNKPILGYDRTKSIRKV